MSDQFSKESKKIRDGFEKSLVNLTTVIGGNTLYKPTRLFAKEVQGAIEELAKEEKEALIKQLKTGVLSLIKKKREHDQSLLQLKKQFEQKEEESMKNFNKEASDLFKLIADIGRIEKNYYDALVSTGVDMPEAIVAEDEENDEKS